MLRINKTILISTLCFFVFQALSAQVSHWKQFEPEGKFPYGQKNPSAPEQLDDFRPMIGICDCKSLRRNADGTWADTTEMIWTFRYILNGNAIQDFTWSEGFYATSIRQFHADSSLWVVGYNSFPGVSTLGLTWLGKKEGPEIVLRQPQKAPNGMDGESRLTFQDISEEGFNWKGEWVNEEMGIVFPFWLIWCQKRTDE